jgi:hypothetical protein
MPSDTKNFAKDVLRLRGTIESLETTLCDMEQDTVANHPLVTKYIREKLEAEILLAELLLLLEAEKENGRSRDSDIVAKGKLAEYQRRNIEYAKNRHNYQQNVDY